MNGNLDSLRDYVARQASLDPALLTGPSFAGLVDARIDHYGLSGPAAYLDLVRQSAAEMDLLVEGIAVPETWLFRYPASYELLDHWLDSRRRGRPAAGQLRMLSVGCATGEEPISMAITALHAGWSPGQVDVDALDRSGRWTAAARQGRFGLRAARPDMPAWARRWLQIVDQQVDVDPVVAGRVRYLHHDAFDWLGAKRGTAAVAAAGPDGGVTGGKFSPVRAATAVGYDVIFCRNLLIYLTRAAGVRLLRRLADALDQDGLLFVGHAELWLAPPEILTPLAAAHTFALRRAEPLLTGPIGGAAVARVAGVAGAERGDVATGATADSDSGPRRSLRVPQGPTAGPAVQPSTPARPGSAPATRTVVPPPTLAATRDLANRGALDQALAAAETILATEGPERELLELLGTLQLALNRLEAARDTFRKVIYLDPNHAEALLQLSMVSQRLGDDDQAARYRRRAERAHHGTTAN